MLNRLTTLALAGGLLLGGHAGRPRPLLCPAPEITFAGVPFATDDRSKMMILGACVAAAADPGWQTVWQGADGNAYPVDAATMIAISDAVEAHVNATFATFALFKADIEAGTITTPEKIDAAFS